MKSNVCRGGDDAVQFVGAGVSLYVNRAAGTHEGSLVKPEICRLRSGWIFCIMS